MRTLLLSGLAATLGCNAGLIDDRANQEIDMVHWRANRHYIAPSCSSPAAFGPGCGLVAVYTATPDFQAKFKDKVCAGVDDVACNALLAKRRDEWLHQLVRGRQGARARAPRVA
jgi:hypothetical protein